MDCTIKIDNKYATTTDQGNTKKKYGFTTFNAFTAQIPTPVPIITVTKVAHRE